MRLPEKNTATCYVRKATPGVPDEYQHADTAWGDPVAIRAVVQPVRGTVNATVYGERITNMKTLHYAGIAEVNQRDGVCLSVGKSDSPDYRVVNISPWPGYRQIDIELIPEEQRGGST